MIMHFPQTYYKNIDLGTFSTLFQVQYWLRAGFYVGFKLRFQTAPIALPVCIFHHCLRAYIYMTIEVERNTQFCTQQT